MKSLTELDQRPIASAAGTSTAPHDTSASIATAFHARSRKNMRVTLNLPSPLLDRMRNTVYWTPGLTLTGLIKSALQNALDGFEQQQGRPFPNRLSELKSGRPRKRQSAQHTARACDQLRARPATGLGSYSN